MGGRKEGSDATGQIGGGPVVNLRKETLRRSRKKEHRKRGKAADNEKDLFHRKEGSSGGRGGIEFSSGVGGEGVGDII